MKTPPRGSKSDPLGGVSHLDVEPVISGNQEVWINRGDAPDDANVLVTLSNHEGERTVLVTPNKIVESSAKLFVVTPPERVETKGGFSFSSVKRVFSLAGYTLAAVMISFSALSATGLVKARIVLTNSMEPSISPGDIVLTMNPDRLKPEVGKVVAYQARRFDGSEVGVFSHRIIDGNETDGWVVKGDNNPNPDTQKPKNNDILGIVFFVIPLVGKFLTKQALLVMAPIAVAIWMGVDALKGSDEDQ
jgi:signal peptidase I